MAFQRSTYSIINDILCYIHSTKTITEELRLDISVFTMDPSQYLIYKIQTR